MDDAEKQILSDLADAVFDLEETLNGQVLQMSALLTALEQTVPGFAQAFVEAQEAEVAEQQKRDSEGTPSVAEAIQKIRKLRKS